MDSSSYRVQFDLSKSYFKDVKRLSKRFPNIRKDLDDFFSEVIVNYRQNCHAASIQGFGRTVWKYRCGSTDLRRGKSGGYRVICCVDSKRHLIYPIAVYAKSDRPTMDFLAIKKLVSAMHGKMGS